MSCATRTFARVSLFLLNSRLLPRLSVVRAAKQSHVILSSSSEENKRKLQEPRHAARTGNTGAETCAALRARKRRWFLSDCLENVLLPRFETPRPPLVSERTYTYRLAQVITLLLRVLGRRDGKISLIKSRPEYPKITPKTSEERVRHFL